MDLNALASVFTQLALPTALVVWFLYQQHVRDKRDDAREQRESEKNAKFAAALDKNTEVMKELSQLNRAALSNYDKMAEAMTSMRETMIRAEQRPCQKQQQVSQLPMPNMTTQNTPT